MKQARLIFIFLFCLLPVYTMNIFATGKAEHTTVPQAAPAALPATRAAKISAIPLPNMPNKHYLFALITKSNSSPYWLAVREGAEAAAKKYGVKVRFEAPANALDLAAQIGIVNNAVTSGVDGIILAAQNPSALLDPVRNALNNQIPVVTVDSGLKPNISQSFLATVNIAAAAALARHTAVNLLNKNGEYAIIDFNHTASTGVERPQGFEQGMSEFPNIKMAGVILYSENDLSRGKSLASNLLVQYPHLKVIFGANDRSALGAAEAVATSDSPVKVVGFDADLGEIKYIKNGIIQASILQSPYDMGFYGVVELLDIIQGKTVPKLVDTGYFLLTPKNINTPQAIKAIQQYAPTYKP